MRSKIALLLLLVLSYWVPSVTQADDGNFPIQKEDIIERLPPPFVPQPVVPQPVDSEEAQQCHDDCDVNRECGQAAIDYDIDNCYLDLEGIPAEDRAYGEYLCYLNWQRATDDNNSRDEACHLACPGIPGPPMPPGPIPLPMPPPQQPEDLIF